MQKNEKTKKNTIEKLRMILDKPSSGELHPEDEKHLKALSKRLEESSKEKTIYIQRRTKREGEEEIDLLKPRVTIHQRGEKKKFDLLEVKHAEPEEKEGLYDVEKVEVEGAEFIEVKPKKIEEKEEKISTEKEEIPKKETPEGIKEEELPEWQPVDTKKLEVPVKEEIKEEKPEVRAELLVPVEEKREELETKEKSKLDEEKEAGKKIKTRKEKKERLVKEKTGEEIIDLERESKIDVFREIKSIDENTAVLLYDHGFTSLDNLRGASLKDLTKIKGVKRKSAKNIKKEIETKFFEPVFVVPKETPSAEEEEIDVFKDINSIDQKTAKILYENGITSVDVLKETPIRQLTKIKGIKRKLAKKIKKELEEITKKTDENNEYFVTEKDVEEWKIEEIDEKPSEQSLRENPFIKEVEEKWDSVYEEKTPEREPEEIKVYTHRGYTLYRKEIEAERGKKRVVHFFSKAEPEEGEPVDLPLGFEVKVNKKTGVPYLKKKK